MRPWSVASRIDENFTGNVLNDLKLKRIKTSKEIKDHNKNNVFDILYICQKKCNKVILELQWKQMWAIIHKQKN